MGDENLGFEALEPGRHGARRLGAVLQSGPWTGWVVDLNRTLAIKLAFEDVGAPEAEADSLLPTEMLGFLRLGAVSMEAACTALDFAVAALGDYDAPDILRAGAVEPADRFRLCAPIPRPGKIIGVASNYPDAGDDPSVRDLAPTLYLKAPSSVIGCEDDVVLPADGSAVFFGACLAAVIGSNAKGVPATEALAHVAGYCAANDLSARLSGVEDPALLGKSCDTFCPLGPELVTSDEVPNPAALTMRVQISSESARIANSKEMRLSVAAIVSQASQRITLEPGDLILTGSAPHPPDQRALRDGDVVEVEIESLGRLRNYVRGPR